MNTTTSTRFARRGTATRTRMLGTLVAVAVAVGIGIGTVGLAACGTETSTDGYEGLSFAGQNPFTSPVGEDDPNLTPADGGGGEQAGDTDALYAQNPDSPSCEADELIADLQGDRAKATAWAEVLGIDVAQIPDFVHSLTPVVLRSDTAVTNHTYVDGTYRAAPAVLATGTAVFVNVYGEPTVKCYSGNPLTRGTSDDRGVTTVTPARNVITHGTYVNPHTGGPWTQEHKLTPEQLVAAARSARALADRDAAHATEDRSAADRARQAHAAADQDLQNARTAVTLREARATWLDGRIADAIRDGAPESVITKLRQQFDAACADLAAAQEVRDGLATVAADRKAEYDWRERLAQRTAERAKQSERAARQAAHAAGLSSAGATGTSGGSGSENGAVAVDAEDIAQLPETTDADLTQPTDEPAEGGDTGQDGEAEQGSDVVAQPSTESGADDQQ